MVRNDALLYSGGSSRNVVREQQEKRAEAAKQAEDQRRVLYPAADIIRDAVTKEKEDTKLQLLKLIGTGTPEDDLKSLVVALNLYDQSMDKLQNKLQNMLRDNKVKHIS